MLRSWKLGAGALAVLVFVVLAYAASHVFSSSSANPTPAAVGTIQLNTASSSPSHAISTTTPPTPIATSTQKVISNKTAVVPSTPILSTTTVVARELSTSGTDLLHSLVNIVCISGVKGIPSISGTGVVIDSRGIIVTAAHVAQLFLLQDYLGTDKVECVIRTGSPARRAYTAEPIFVSSSWLKANPHVLTTASPTGNGQYDVAILGITGTATSTPLPNYFAATPLTANIPTGGEQVAIGSYGAQYLSSTDLNYSLYPILVFGSIASRYTYGTGSVDLFSVRGSAASQEGSSGGGVTDSAGHLIGIITTSSIEGSIQERVLNVISAAHIRSTYAADTGVSLDTTLSGNNVADLIHSFKSQAYTLGEQLYVDVRDAQ